MVWLYIIIGLIAFFFYAYIRGKNLDKRLMELAASRPVLSKGEYIRQLVAQGYDETTISILYDELQAHVPKGFSIYPGDDLQQVLKLDPEDLEEIVIKIHNTLKLKLRNQQDYQDINAQHKHGLGVNYMLDVITRSKSDPAKNTPASQ